MSSDDSRTSSLDFTVTKGEKHPTMAHDDAKSTP